ncbi:MAG: hypothetical protein IJL98_03620 [Lachnospiraceae bacterium]|nr:hypothetical protein [Lachnospiraceae bacterium]
MEKQILDDGRSRYLRLEDESVPENMYEIRMINHNKPEGLLVFHMEETGKTVQYDYFISGLSSLKSCTEEDDTDYLYSVIFALEHLSDVFYEYMLSPDRLELDPETVFVRKETGSLYFCYYPGKKSSFQQSLQELMEFFVKVMDPNDEPSVLLLYGLYRKSREENVTMKTLAEFWRERKNEERNLLYQEAGDGEFYAAVSASQAGSGPDGSFRTDNGSSRSGSSPYRFGTGLYPSGSSPYRSEGSSFSRSSAGSSQPGNSHYRQDRGETVVSGEEYHRDRRYQQSFGEDTAGDQNEGTEGFSGKEKISRELGLSSRSQESPFQKWKKARNSAGRSDMAWTSEDSDTIEAGYEDLTDGRSIGRRSTGKGDARREGAWREEPRKDDTQKGGSGKKAAGESVLADNSGKIRLEILAIIVVVLLIIWLLLK